MKSSYKIERDKSNLVNPKIGETFVKVSGKRNKCNVDPSLMPLVSRVKFKTRVKDRWRR